MVLRKALQEFLESAKEAMDSLSLDNSLPPPSIRASLLARQQEVLQEIVTKYNTETTSVVTVLDMKEALKNIPPDDTLLTELSDQLNSTARTAYARLVLYSACRRASEQSLRDQMKLKASGSMERQDLLELFALVSTALKNLSCVQEYVASGRPLFPELPVLPSSSEQSSPPDRLERIQHLYLGELGYDAVFGTEEIKRIFFSPTAAHNEFTGDQELADALAKTMAAMRETITKVNLQSNATQFSDVESGGVTRVVTVDYSESDDTATPRGQAMAEQNEERQKRDLRVASQAAALQQKIIDELMSMNVEERKERLAHAAQVSNDLMRHALDQPPGPERIEFLRSIPESTQRLMAMHKIWEGVVAANGGKEPTSEH